jgi:uncharacterized membrane protein YphA (DoxX/SURF4 family)
MNIRNIAYWGTTGLAAAGLTAGGLGQLTRSPEMVAGLTHLGYPLYVATLLGTWKVLGALAIVAPRLPRLKELAYAGILFLTTGAAFSHAVSGDPAGKVVAPLFILALAAASYALRPASRTLGAPLLVTEPEHAPPRTVAAS